MGKTVCFIGHRSVSTTDTLQKRMLETIERLIKEEGATDFLFGSRSSFNSLCHDAVTMLQQTYPNIRRIAYTCRHECVTVKSDASKKARTEWTILKRPIQFREYEDEYEHPTKYVSGRASYVERNQAMIDSSDFCVFYFDETYLPPRRSSRNDLLPDRQPRSGTDAAYKYALRKGKTIINLYDTVDGSFPTFPSK